MREEYESEKEIVGKRTFKDNYKKGSNEKHVEVCYGNRATVGSKDK